MPLAIVLCPRGGGSLRSELIHLQRAGIDTLVSLLSEDQVEMLELTWLNAARHHEPIDVFHFDPDHPPELIGRQVPLVNEPVEAAQGDAQASGGLFGTEPFDLVGH